MKIVFLLSSDYVDYTITTDDNSNIVRAKSSKNVYLRVEYKEVVPSNQLVAGVYNSDDTMQVGMTSNIQTSTPTNPPIPISTEEPILTPTPNTTFTPVPTATPKSEDVKVPDTYARSRILYVVLAVIVIGAGIYYYKKKKYVTLSLVVIGVLLIVSSRSSFALCKTNILIDSNVEIESIPTKFKTGQEVNARMKQFVNSSATYSSNDMTITEIKRFVGVPDSSNLIDENIVSTLESKHPIYMWYDSSNTTIYWYSEANTVYYNEDSSYFYGQLRRIKSLPDLGEISSKFTTNMSYMFSSVGSYYNAFEIDLGDNFDTSNVTDMSYMFYGLEYVTTIYAPSSFVTTNVINSEKMFYLTYQLVGEKATIYDYSHTKIDATYAHVDGGASNPGYFTSREEFDGAMFKGGPIFNGTIKKMINSNSSYRDEDNTITSISRFSGTPDDTNLIDDNIISTWTSKYPIYMWYDSSNAAIYWYSDTNNVYYPPNSNYYYGNLKSMNSMDLNDEIKTDYVGTMLQMFCNTGYNNTSFTLDLGDNFDTSLVKDMSTMFKGTGYNSTVMTLDLGDKFNTSNVIDMGSMFWDTGNKSTVFTLDLGDNFDTSSVTNMGYMFCQTGYKSKVFTLDLGDKFDTSKVTSMDSMFNFLGNSSSVFTLNLGNNFDTSSVTNMNDMFNYTGGGNTSFTLDLGNKFDTSKVTNMSNMFSNTGQNSTIFTLNLGSKFDTSSVTDMSYMFSRTGYKSTAFTSLDLGLLFDTSSVTNMSSMFQGHLYLTTIYAPTTFVTTKVTSSNNMFSGNNNLEGGQGTHYSNSNPSNAAYAHIDGGTSNPGYFAARP